MQYPKWTTCLLALFPVVAGADPQPWMDKQDPVTLPYIAYAKAECPVSTRRVTSLVETLLVEAGLKPERAWPFPHSMFLRAKVECIEFQLDTFAFVTTIGFGRLQDGRMVFELYDTGDIGVVTRGNASFILESLELGLECAVSDYLEANFDEEQASGDKLPSGEGEPARRHCSARAVGQSL